MKINIKATKLDLTPSITEYIEDKIGALDKHVKKFETEEEAVVRVEIARSTNHHKQGLVYHAEANFKFKGGLIRAENESDDIRAAIDKVKDKLKIEIEKYKDKKMSGKRITKPVKEIGE